MIEQQLKELRKKSNDRKLKSKVRSKAWRDQSIDKIEEDEKEIGDDSSECQGRIRGNLEE
jgi:hypothetical protein